MSKNTLKKIIMCRASKNCGAVNSPKIWILLIISAGIIYGFNIKNFIKKFIKWIFKINSNQITK